MSAGHTHMLTQKLSSSKGLFTPRHTCCLSNIWSRMNGCTCICEDIVALTACKCFCQSKQSSVLISCLYHPIVRKTGHLMRFGLLITWQEHLLLQKTAAWWRSILS